MLDRFFGGKGACMTVCNATIGLMLAIKEAVGDVACRTVCPDAGLYFRGRGARGGLVWPDASALRH